jgi:hypothetical protein
MRETRLSDSEGGGAELNRSSLPLSLCATRLRTALGADPQSCPRITSAFGQHELFGTFSAEPGEADKVGQCWGMVCVSSAMQSMR